MERIHALAGREGAFGAANVLLCLATIFVAVIKPRIGKVKP
jgi:hypothetical protein